MARLLTPLVFFALAAATAFAADTGFVQKSFKNPDGHESPFVVWVPPTYDGSTPVPVILFLHGSGETKGGKKMPKDVGIGPYLPMTRNVPVNAIVVIPQSENKTWKADSDDGKRAVAILDAVMAEYKTDPSRTYLTGLSMGGSGTWSLAAAYPERWAAIAPVCGSVGGKDDPPAKVAEAVRDTAEKVKNIPCWVWIGDKDKSIQKNRDLIAALKAVGGSPKYTELADVGHESWDAAYATNDLYEWLLAQKKTK